MVPLYQLNLGASKDGPCLRLSLGQSLFHQLQSNQFLTYMLCFFIGGSLLQGRMSYLLGMPLIQCCSQSAHSFSPCPCHPDPNTMLLNGAQSPLHTTFRLCRALTAAKHFTKYTPLMANNSHLSFLHTCSLFSFHIFFSFYFQDDENSGLCWNIFYNFIRTKRPKRMWYLHPEILWKYFQTLDHALFPFTWPMW